MPEPLFEVQNNPVCVAIAEKAVEKYIGADALTDCTPWMASETFAITSRLYPGVLTFTGIENKEKRLRCQSPHAGIRPRRRRPDLRRCYLPGLCPGLPGRKTGYPLPAARRTTRKTRRTEYMKKRSCRNTTAPFSVGASTWDARSHKSSLQVSRISPAGSPRASPTKDQRSFLCRG